MQTDLQKEDKDLMRKLDNFSNKYDIELNYIKKEIRKGNKIALAVFAKDPNKQNFYEKTAAKYISKIEGVRNFKNLGNQELYICGGVVFGKEKLEQYPKAKTIDFCWEYASYKVYASHKYTSEEGGSQGSAYKDLQLFIEEARENKENNTLFLVIADGVYYTKIDRKLGITRIENLKSSCTKSVSVCSIYGLRDWLERLKQHL